MEELFRSYLSFLRSMRQGLDSLTELAEKKLAAAQKDDLMALNELLNQEQAQALHFRGLEITRDRLLPQLGLVGIPMSRAPERFPAALRDEARQAVEDVQAAYLTYRKTSVRTRSFLEQTLHEVEQAIVEMGGPPVEEQPQGPGYRKGPENGGPPPSMKTDFRA